MTLLPFLLNLNAGNPIHNMNRGTFGNSLYIHREKVVNLGLEPPVITKGKRGDKGRQKVRGGGIRNRSLIESTVLDKPALSSPSSSSLLSYPASDPPCAIRSLSLSFSLSRAPITTSTQLLSIPGDAMAEAPASPGGGSHDSGDHSPRSGGVREQDRYLPIANISRIMKKALPANGKIAKDAKETVQECVSEFISFITSEASDKCQREKRKTINGDDLLWAMATLGFEDYLDPLKIYLARYREMEGDTKGSAKGGEASAKRDGAAVQSVPNAQIAYQGSFSHGTNYSHSQVHHPALPMHGAE